MAGGIDTLAPYTANTPLNVTGGAAGSGGGIMSGGMGALMMSNPYTAIAGMVLQALSAPKTDISKAGANALSGAAFFGAENEQAFNKPQIDLANPLHVVIASAVVMGAIYAFKKYKG